MVDQEGSDNENVQTIIKIRIISKKKKTSKHEAKQMS